MQQLPLFVYGLLGAFVFGTARLNAVYWTEKDAVLRRKMIADYLYALASGAIFGQLASEPTQVVCQTWLHMNLNLTTSAGLIGLVCQYWADVVAFVKRKYKVSSKEQDE